MLRYNPDGSLYATFDGDGIVVTNFTGSDGATRVGLLPDGKILVGGSSGQDLAVARYNSDGTLDTTFGINGLATFEISGNQDLVIRLLLQNDGKIIAVGHTGGGLLPFSDIAMARFNQDGSPDLSFGLGGAVTTDFANSPDRATDALITNGKILVAGSTGALSTSDFAMVRYNLDGSLDTSFADDGRLATDLGMGSAEFNTAMVIQNDGRIVLGGTSNEAGDFDFALARYIFVGGPPIGFPGGSPLKIPFLCNGAAIMLALLLGLAGFHRLLN